MNQVHEYLLKTKMSGFEQSSTMIDTGKLRAIDDRRRLILARRMATRKRAGPACAACKTRRIKCSKLRPCHRCSTLRIDCCEDERINTNIESMQNHIGVEPAPSPASSEESRNVGCVRMDTLQRCTALEVIICAHSWKISFD